MDKRYTIGGLLALALSFSASWGSIKSAVADVSEVLNVADTVRELRTGQEDNAERIGALSANQSLTIQKVEQIQESQRMQSIKLDQVLSVILEVRRGD